MPLFLRTGFLLFLVACGTSAPTLRPAPAAEEDPPQEPAPERTDSPALSPSTARAFLDGRFRALMPTEVRRMRSAHPAREKDELVMESEGCELMLLAVSVGLLRPANLAIGEDEERVRPAASGLEVLTTNLRRVELLGSSVAALGAAVFEPGGSATDLSLWPVEAVSEEFQALQSEASPEDWFAFQRNHSRLERCYAVAQRVMSELVHSLECVQPYEVVPRLTFGYDEATEGPANYEGALPEGWTVSTRAAFDAVFERVHPRQEWSWTPSAPLPRAELWAFSGGDERPVRGTRENVFGYPLRFDAEGCTRVVDAQMPYQQYLCLHGTRAEKRQLLEVLRTFQRTSPEP